MSDSIVTNTRHDGYGYHVFESDNRIWLTSTNTGWVSKETGIPEVELVELLKHTKGQTITLEVKTVRTTLIKSKEK